MSLWVDISSNVGKLCRRSEERNNVASSKNNIRW